MSCKSLRLTLLVVGFISMSAWTRLASAAPVVYFDRDNNTNTITSFPNSQAQYNQLTSALTSFGVETVESLSGGNPTLTFGSTGITATTQGVTVQQGFAIGTKALIEADSAQAVVNSVFNFNQYINAFGMFVIQGGDLENDNPTTFRLRDTAAAPGVFVDVTRQVGPDWGFDNVLFLGVLDAAPFNQVTIIETGDLGDFQLYDNVVAGVPEPTSLVLMALGGIVVASRAIRSRRR